jgi:hypothetical protein
MMIALMKTKQVIEAAIEGGMTRLQVLVGLRSNIGPKERPTRVEVAMNLVDAGVELAK